MPKNVTLFCDGIQLSVNSDKELDYVDDLLGEEEGSIDQDDQDNDISQLDVPGDSANTVSDFQLGATSASLNDEQVVMNNPHLCKLLNKMLDERMEEAHQKGETSSSQLLTHTTPGSATKGKVNVQRGISTNVNETTNKLIKSPSDTTIYAPALKKNTEVFAKFWT